MDQAFRIIAFDALYLLLQHGAISTDRELRRQGSQPLCVPMGNAVCPISK